MRKALALARDLYPICVVIGADTIVVIDGGILGKPGDEEEERRKFREENTGSLQDFSILKPKTEVLPREVLESRVKIKILAPWKLEGYINKKEPMNKSGACGARGTGAFMVEEIHCSYTNVVGLPLAQLVNSLTKLGILKLLSKDEIS